jgi:hypothetical protein
MPLLTIQLSIFSSKNSKISLCSLISALFVHHYGPIVTANLRRLPTAVYTADDLLLCQLPWVRAPLDHLIDTLCDVSLDDLAHCIHTLVVGPDHHYSRSWYLIFFENKSDSPQIFLSAFLGKSNIFLRDYLYILNLVLLHCRVLFLCAARTFSQESQT